MSEPVREEPLSATARNAAASLFRVVEGEPPDMGGAGSAVLVSAGAEHGHALTCWHNIDPLFSHAREWTEAEAVDLPLVRALPAGARDLATAPGARPRLMGRWSNPGQDVAVLRLSAADIARLGLRPARLSFRIRPGDAVIVRGFERPWVEAPLSWFRGQVPAGANTYTTQLIPELGSHQALFRVVLEVPWERGLGGGGVFRHDNDALVGIACLLDADPGGALSTRHRALGFAIPLSAVAERWPEVRSFCEVFEDGH